MNNKPVLQVDRGGMPQGWMSIQDAAVAVANKNVSWSYGEIRTLTGGMSRLLGVRSTLVIPAILATRGHAKFNLADGIPSLTNEKLFERDRHMCAYCGETLHDNLLNREHIHPTSRGGEDSWKNVVTTCKPCNSRKGNMTVEEAGLSLLYLPYEPNWYENVILERGGKRILADQMEFLTACLPAHSRLL